MAKKKHTRKALILTTKDRKVRYMSNLYRGKVHDYAILKEEFPNKTKWFVDKKVLLDLGFQGFQNLYTTLETLLPHKRKRVKKGEENALSESQKQENKAQAQVRIYVEHSIGGIKRFRIIYNQIRMKRQHDMDITLGICAGLWNFLIC